jgi:ABC-2 type transport system permease protein
MKGLLNVFRYELRRQSTRRAYLFMTLALPLIVVLGFHALQAYSQNRPAPTEEEREREAQAMKDLTLPIGVVDGSGLLTTLSPLRGLLSMKDEASAQQAITENRIGAYYLIDPDYLETGKVKLAFARFTLTNVDSAAFRSELINGLLKRSGKTLPDGLITRLQARLQAVPYEIDASGAHEVNQQDTSFWLAYVFSVVLMISSFLSSGYLMQSIVEEKENRVIEILLSSVRPAHLLGGKVFALGLLGLVQIAAWGAAVVYILSRIANVLPPGIRLTLPSGGQLALVALYFILSFIMVALLYAAIGTLATSMREGPQLAAVVTIPIAFPLYFLQVIISGPHSPLAVGLSLFPLTAPIAMVSRLAVTEVPLLEIVIGVALLLLTIAGGVWLAGRLFRVSTLLSGRLPKLREIPALLRAN